ncbi:Stage II sporulation protein [Planctomycetes bacterium MalM25]|nr:Stage II sporulation protein [Planctomycetes bacterium MalM25]
MPIRYAALALGLLLPQALCAQSEFDAQPTINVTGSGLVPMESDYLPNVVKSENGLASFEALKAQAVAARTYAYYQIDNKGFINDGTSDQVYSGPGSPRQIHFDAAAATEGEILWVRDDIGVQRDVLIAAFYVAGSIPSGPFDPDNPGVISEPGDTDPTSTQQWVTFPYADGEVAGFNQGTPLGFQGTVNNPNWPNRGAKSQNGADYLSDNSVNYLDILKYYYGADIQLRTAQTEGTSVEYGRKVLTTFDDYGSGRASDGTIDGHEGVFHRSPTLSGSTTANLAGSDAVRDDAESHEGSHSQRIDFVYNEASGEDFLMRHLSGAKYSDTDGASNAATRLANLQFESIGSVGFWLKTDDAGLEVSLAIDDPETGERGVRRSVIADGEWHEYKWGLDRNADWEAWTAGGDGVIDGINVSLDSVQFFGSSDATVYLDTVFWDPGDTFNPTAVGDFNADGVVDAADYTVWQDAFLSLEEGHPADANGDGFVGNDDYDIWAANYGATPGVASVAVPEPSAVWGVSLAVIVGLSSRRQA